MGVFCDGLPSDSSWVSTVISISGTAGWGRRRPTVERKAQRGTRTTAVSLKVGLASSWGCHALLAGNRTWSSGTAYIKKVLADVAVLFLFLEVDIASSIDDKNLAILSNDTLANPSWGCRGAAGGTVARSRGLASLLGRGAALLLPGLPLLETPLLAVHGLRWAVLLLNSRGGGRSWSSIDLGNIKAFTPGCVPCKLDVTFNKPSVSLLVHVEDKVVHAASVEHKDTDHGGAESGAVAVVVVVVALPQGKLLRRKWS